MLTQFSAATPVRLARPIRDLKAAEEFYVRGLGLQVLYRSDDPAEFGAILIVGLPGAGWHLELVRPHEHTVQPTPTEEDLLVLYLGETPDEDAVAHLLAHGGTRQVAANPYWERWGVTVSDPDGYRVVLSSRSWQA